MKDSVMTGYTDFTSIKRAPSGMMLAKLIVAWLDHIFKFLVKFTAFPQTQTGNQFGRIHLTVTLRSEKLEFLFRSMLILENSREQVRSVTVKWHFNERGWTVSLFLIHLEVWFYEIDLGRAFSRVQFISDILEHLEMFKWPLELSMSTSPMMSSHSTQKAMHLLVDELLIFMRYQMTFR